MKGNREINEQEKNLQPGDRVLSDGTTYHIGLIYEGLVAYSWVYINRLMSDVSPLAGMVDEGDKVIKREAGC